MSFRGVIGWVAVLLAVAGGCSVESNVSRSVGAQCSSHSQCDMTCLSGAEFPDGFCTVGCETDADCPGDAVCVDRDQGVCLSSCDTTSQCMFLGPQWQCSSMGARPIGEVTACIGG